MGLSVRRKARERMRVKNRRMVRGRSLRLEFLEHRMVLDGTAGATDCLPQADATVADANLEHCEVSTEPTDSVRRLTSTDELRDYAMQRAIEQWKSYFGTSAANNWFHVAMPVTDFRLLDSSFSGRLAMASVAFDTNVQVAGVDEGDEVKTDGEYLYVLSGDQKLAVIDIRDPSNLKVVARVSVESFPRDIYVTDGRLTIISEKIHLWAVPVIFNRTVDDLPRANEGPQFEVAVYDIADPEVPALISKTTLDGQLVQTRAVGNQIYLVSSSNLNIPHLNLVCDAAEDGEDGSDDSTKANEIDADGRRRAKDVLHPREDCRYETEEEYTARVSPLIVDLVMPDVKYATADGVGTTSKLISVEDLYVDGVNTTLLTTTIFDTSDTPRVTLSAGVITTSAHQIYANEQHIYVAGAVWNENNTTRIHQFTIDDEVELTASGDVTGVLLNQFSMDEYEGRLRIATTEGWATTASSNLYILGVEGNELEIVGSVDNIAPGESIFAARFMGDSAFLVTFVRTDPVFAIDLSNPEDPTILGELEIPGFSNYLHPLAEGYLIGIGRDADPGTGQFLDPQVSIFDVRDLADPKLLDREIIEFEGAWSWSAAFESHHAVNFYPDLGLLTVPFAGDSQGFRVAIRGDDGNWNLPADGWTRFASDLREGNGSGEDEGPKSGLYVFHLDPAAENPIEIVGVISHEQHVRRSLRVANHLFVVSSDTVTSHAIDDLETVSGRAYFGRITQNDVVTIEAAHGPTAIDVLKNDRTSDPIKITSVGETQTGGTVAISDDGRLVFYTPPTERQALDQGRSAGPDGTIYLYEGPRSYDSFTYTVELSDGSVETAWVEVNIVYERPGQRVGELAKADLARRLNVEPGSIELLSIESRIWNDGCLGVEAPNQACTMALVQGFRIILGHDGSSFVYHTDLRSTVVFVERSDPPVDDGPQNDRFRVRGGSSDNKLDVLANDFPGITFIKAPEVTAVTETRAGGIVTIVDDGLMLLYTPPEGFSGEDTFSYTVDGGPSAKVVVHVVEREPNDPPDDGESLVGIDLEITDEAGNPLSGIEIGQTFFVNILVDDLRENGGGVFGAYLDVEFNGQLAQVASELAYEEIYSNGKSGEVSEGLIDEVGAFTNSLEPLGGTPQRLMRIPFEALAEGRLVLATNPADNRPILEITLFGLNEAINPRRVDYGEAILEITNGMHNASEPTDVNGDLATTPLDVLNTINEINRGGSGSVRQLMRAALANHEGESTTRSARKFYDVNNDGYLTPLDPLRIINRLNAQASERSLLASTEGEAAVVTILGPTVSMPLSSGATDESSDPANSSPFDVGSISGQSEESDEHNASDCPRSADAADDFFAELGL